MLIRASSWPNRASYVDFMVCTLFDENASLKPLWPLLPPDEEKVREFYSLFSWNKIWGVWHSTSSVQFFPIATQGDTLLLLLPLGFETVPPSLMRICRLTSWRRFASSRRGHPCGSSLTDPSCCIFLLPEACMQLHGFCSCHEARWWGRVRPIGFPCWGISLIVSAWWTIHLLPLGSWPRCRTWGYTPFLMWWSGGCIGMPTRLGVAPRSTFLSRAEPLFQLV